MAATTLQTFFSFTLWRDYYFSCSPGGRVWAIIGGICTALFLYASTYTLIYKSSNNRSLMGKNAKNLKYRNVDKSIFSSTSVVSIVNPISGNRMGLRRWKKYLNKYKNTINIQTNYTKNCHAAKELGMAIPKNNNDQTVIVAGGDGMLNEVVQGIFHNSPPDATFPNINLAILPAGTGNGVSKSLGIDNYYLLADALEAGSVTKVDIILTTIEKDKSTAHKSANRNYSSKSGNNINNNNNNKATYRGLLSVAWGAIADFDYLSEGGYRWLGPLRPNLIGLYIVFRNTSYKGRVFWKAEKDSVEQSITGEFFMVHACNMPWIATDCFISPQSKVGDGKIYLVIMQKTSTFEGLKLFLNAETGKHIQMDTVKYISCVSFGIEPEIDPIKEKNSKFVIDGNLCEEYNRLEAHSVPGALNMYIRELEDNKTE